MLAWKDGGNPSLPGRSRCVYQSLQVAINTLYWKPVFIVKPTSPYPFVNGINKFLIGSAQGVRLRVDKAFTIVISLACDWSPLLILFET